MSSIQEIVDKRKGNKPFFQKMQLSKKEENPIKEEFESTENTVNTENTANTENTVEAVNTEKTDKKQQSEIQKKAKSKSDKIKYTFYIPKEALDQFNAIIGKKMINGEKVDRGDVLAEIIKYYYIKG